MGLIDSAKNFLQSDVVKNGVREMMIASPEDNKHLIWKHPDRTIPMFSQVTVRADEWAVFAKEGRPVGTLDAGRTTLSTSNIPFLSNFIDQYTGGNFLTTELFFVKRTPVQKKFGGTLGNMIDPMTSIRLQPRCHGEMMLRVENPEKLIYEYIGMGKHQDDPEPLDFLIKAFFLTLKSTIGKLAREQRRSVVDIMDMQDAIATDLIGNSTELSQTGVRIVRVIDLQVNLSDADLKRFDEMRQKVAEQMVGVQVDEISIQRAALQAQAAAAAAQVNVSTAQYQAQAAQFALDQRRANDAAYVQMAGGDIGRLGQFEAMRGAGAGLAQGGGNTGLAGMAAQVGIGASLGSNLAGGALGGLVGGGAGALGGAMAAGAVAGGAAAQQGNQVTCPHCNARVVPGKFCAECGGNIQAAAKKVCSGCGVELAPGARFCPECGNPSTPPAQR